MQRVASLVLALGLTACASGGPAPEPVRFAAFGLVLPDLSGPPMPPSRVVLISVAGLLPDHYRRAGLAGGREPAPMRTLAQLAERGVFADAVEVVTPAAVHPVHATLVTGRSPRRHGVFADRLLGEHGVRHARFEHATRLQGPSLWLAAKSAQLAVAALGWPTTTGASLDFLLPDVQPERGESWPGGFSPDSRRVVFAARRAGVWGLRSIAVDGSDEQVLLLGEGPETYYRYPNWSPRGDRIVYERGQITSDIWELRLE